MFTRILVPLDGGARAEEALAVARDIAARNHGSIIILHMAACPANGPETTEAEAELARYAAPLHAAGLDVQVVTRPDISEDGIAAVAREERADLIVLAPNERIDVERLSHIARPSVSVQMVSHAPVPFLIVPSHQPADPIAGFPSAPEARIMVALDGSQLAEQAIPFAVAVARSFGRRLLLVRVVPVAPLGLGTGSGVEAVRVAAQTLLEEEQEAHRYVASVRSAIVATSPIKIQTRVVAGDPTEKLLGVAVEEGAGLLVLATHGRGRIARAVLGSVAAALVRRTTVPLLIVPATVAPVPPISWRM